ncbi:MAG: 5-oxoprolinase subunit PxpB [Acidobacteria bacterium]|nr:5-oxoprolinase subunit PxpB [Acidobacteriota bacterium]
MRIRHAGDAMLLVELEQVIDPVVNQRAIELGRLLRARDVPGVRDIVPGYCSLGIHFDPLRTDLVALERAIREDASVAGRVVSLPEPVVHEIPVVYGGAVGPDLQAVADFAGCSPAEVIERHAAVTYRVYMLGFVPGFAYLGRVNASIAAPRRRVPRDVVPAGSLGIAGEQTGVYPAATPGGWQIIGRTSVVMFDAARTPASLLAPGDLVHFVPR